MPNSDVQDTFSYSSLISVFFEEINAATWSMNQDSIMLYTSANRNSAKNTAEAVNVVEIANEAVVVQFPPNILS